MTGKFSITCALALLGLVTAARADADGRSVGPPHGPAVGHTGNSCVVGCQRDQFACLMTAGAAARTCEQTTCSTELHTVRTACGANRHSDACQAALAAARLCLTPCLDALAAAKDTCRANEQACAGACPVPTPPDHGGGNPLCVAGCRADFQICRDAATAEAQACHMTCDPLTQAARAACSGHMRTAECQTAVEAARACLRPCEDARRAALRTCLSTAHDCVHTCPTRTPNPTPTPTP